jgi:hypothetical protein
MPRSYLGVGRRRRRVHRRGGNILSDIGNALSTAHGFIRRNKLISTVGNALGAVGVPYAGAIGKAASVLGYGRRRRVHRRRRGGDLRSILTSAHKFAKEKRLLSSALRHFLPNSNLHKAAHVLGYGRRRRVRRRRGGDVKSILSSAHKFVKDRRLVSSALRHFGHHKLAAASRALGYGRRRRVVHRRAMHHRGYGGANFFTTEQIAAPKF